MLGQFCFGNNLLTQIRKNADFLQQKPWQLPSAEVNFEGWNQTLLKALAIAECQGEFWRLKSNIVLKVLFALISVNKDLEYKFTSERERSIVW